MTIKPLLLTLLTLLLIGCNPTNPTPTNKAFRHTSTPTNTQAILKLDTKGHTALIKDIIVTKSGDIISASDDKTVRVWDSTTGKEKQKILGQIGAGSGEIYAMALSPNNEFLAVGGFFGNSSKTWGNIRIYNYKTGELLKVLKSHRNVVNDLAFSRDGKYLISGSIDFTAKIWKTDDFSLIDTISFHKAQVYAVKIIKKGSDYFAVTAGYDNQIALYDMAQRKVVNRDRKNYKLHSLAVSQNHIAVCGESKEIAIYDLSLNPITTIDDSETEPAGLAYSPNGEFLIAGTATSPRDVNIYSVKRAYQKIQSFQKHTNATIAVAFLDNQTAISGGGDNFEMYIWKSKTAQVLKKIEGAGEIVWSVGVDGESVAWGNKWTATKGKSKLQKYIDLKTFNIQRVTNPQTFKRISTKYKNYSLIHRKGGNYGKSDAILDIKRDGKRVASIIRSSTNGYSHRCYGFYKEYIISGGSNGFLKIYNLKGQEVANLVGHIGEVWAIALDGDRLVSGSDDQTIRIWDLSKLKMKSEKRKMTIYPQLNLFISKTNEWIAWTPSGYYNASVEGAKYVGFHINQGPNHEAYYVSADKYPNFYRPDIIEAVLKTGSEKRAIKLVSKYRKVKAVDIVSETPPIISLITPSNITTREDRVEIKLSIQSNSPIKKFIVLKNGQKIDTRGVQLKSNLTLNIDLDSGENIISIRAKNQYSISDEVIVRATKISNSSNQNIANIYKPTLYLLSIGVSQYKNSDYNLKVADKDAHAVSQMFKSQEGKIYKKVVVKELLNQNAITDNILDGLDWIEKETTQKDVAIIFIAGHGINDNKGNYYFMSYNGDAERPRRTALKWLEIKDTVENLPSKVILLADTCHSGNITGSSRKRDITGAIKSILDTGTGTIVMSATTGMGYSYEKDEWGHGAFTKALLEGIGDGKADYPPKNGTVTIKEIDLYITERVKTLTDGKQKPTTKMPDSIPNFAIGEI